MASAIFFVLHDEHPPTHGGARAAGATGGGSFENSHGRHTQGKGATTLAPSHPLRRRSHAPALAIMVAAWPPPRPRRRPRRGRLRAAARGCRPGRGAGLAATALADPASAPNRRPRPSTSSPGRKSPGRLVVTRTAPTVASTSSFQLGQRRPGLFEVERDDDRDQSHDREGAQRRSARVRDDDSSWRRPPVPDHVAFGAGDGRPKDAPEAAFAPGRVTRARPDAGPSRLKGPWGASGCWLAASKSVYRRATAPPLPITTPAAAVSLRASRVERPVRYVHLRPGQKPPPAPGSSARPRRTPRRRSLGPARDDHPVPSAPVPGHGSPAHDHRANRPRRRALPRFAAMGGTVHLRVRCHADQADRVDRDLARVAARIGSWARASRASTQLRTCAR